MTDRIFYLDLETMGLDAAIHPVWEVGAIIDGVEFQWFVRVHPDALALADPKALEINRFAERYDPDAAVSLLEVVRDLAGVLTGPPRAVVGANPHFDLVRLEPWFDLAGIDYPWHYRPICIESVVYGWYSGLAGGMGEYHPDPPWVPWKARDLYRDGLGMEQPEDDQHTALGDCRFVKALWERINPPGEPL